VMYAGQVQETGDVAGLLRAARHPYTRGLLAAVPRVRGPRRERIPAIPGAVPVLAESPPGCRFADRCPEAHDRCAEAPELRAVSDPTPGRAYRCWLDVPRLDTGVAP
jgi:peptide/nickel transport system ATP-binding protein